MLASVATRSLAMAEQAPEPCYPHPATSKLRAPTRTCYFNSFFLFKAEVALDGRPAEIGCSQDGELSLSCRREQDGESDKRSVSFPSIFAKVEGILKNYGVFEVITFFCEDSPLFQVTFSTEDELKRFLRRRERVEKELADLFSHMLQPTTGQAQVPATPIPALVSSTLFLMTPDWFVKDCGLIKVNLENYSDCVFVWRCSKVFEFGNVLCQKENSVKGISRQIQATSTSDLRQGQDTATSTSDLRQGQDTVTGTSTSDDLRQGQDTATSTSDLRQGQHKNTCTTDLPALISDSSSASESEAEVQILSEAKKRDESGEISVGSVVRWLEEVCEWFYLGTYLSIPQHELKIIQLNHPSNNKECRVAMVDTWIRLGNASWSDLVRALWEIGECDLAKKMADNFDIALPAAASDEQASSGQRELLKDISQREQRLVDKTASLVLAKETKNKDLEEIAEQRRQLNQHVTTLPQLELEKEQLSTQLRETQEGHQKLEELLGKQTHALHILNQEATRLHGQLELKDREITKMVEEAKVLQAKLQKKTEELENATNTLRKLKEQQQLLKDDLEWKRQELKKEQLKSLFKDDTIHELKGELTASKTETNLKMKEIGSLEGRLLAQSEEVEKLWKELREAEQRKPVLPQQPSTAAILQQQLLQAMEAADLRVKLATAEEGRQEVERQLGALQRQVQLPEEEMKRVNQKEGVKLYTAKCTGPGLKEVTVYREGRFNVFTVTEGGEKFEDLNAVVTGELVSENGGVVKCQVSKKEENSYELQYQPQHKGRSQLHVKVNGSHVKDSPFEVAVVENLQLAQGTHVKTIDDLQSPYNLAVSHREEIVIAENNSHCISVFDGEGRKLLSFGNQGSADMKLASPRGVALLSDNTVLVAANHCVKKFRMDGTFIASVGSEGSGKLQFYYPWGVAADERGKKIYVCDTSNHRIQVLNFDLSYHSSFESEDTGPQNFHNPQGIAIDSHQNVFVADCDNNRVQVFNSEGGFLYQIEQRGREIDGLSLPVSVCIDRDDNVYVLEYGKCRVSIFSNKGNFIKSFGRYGYKAGEFKMPYGIAVDTSGCVYISDYENNQMQVFNA